MGGGEAPGLRILAISVHIFSPRDPCRIDIHGLYPIGAVSRSMHHLSEKIHSKLKVSMFPC